MSKPFENNLEGLLKQHSRTILLPEINFEGVKKLNQSKILIIGAGGLASTIIPLIASSGVGKISLWEADSLDISNLQRQFIYKFSDIGKSKSTLALQFIKNLNPNIDVSITEKFLSKNTFDEFLKYADEFDCIIDSTDSFESRSLANKACIIIKKPFFTGSAIGFEGQVYSFLGFRYDLPCYACIYGSDYLIFKEQRTCANSGVFPPMPAIIGSIISQNVLQFIATEKLDFNKFIKVNFNKSPSFKEIIMQKDSLCPECKI